MTAASAVAETAVQSGPATLLDVVRRAVSSDNGEFSKGDKSYLAADCFRFSEDQETDVGEVRKADGKIYTDDLVLRRKVAKFEEVERLRHAREEKAFSELESGLRRANTLTASSLLAELRPFLEFVDPDKKRQHGAGEDQIGDSDGITCSTGNDEEAILGLLRKNSARLGQTVVVLIIQSSLAVKYWRLIQVLVECNVVSGRLCDELIQQLVEAGNAVVICSCVRHVLDLRPSHILAMLRFILAGSQVSFREVHKDWKVATDAAITAAAKKQNRPKLGKESNGKGKKATLVSRFGQVGTSIGSALALAMAVDGFAASELCLHNFVASEQDEAVLASVIGMLTTDEVLSVLRYLSKWVDKYHGRLAHDPLPRGTKRYRIPTFPQVLSWASIILDVHYARFALASELSTELRTLQQSIRAMAHLSSKVSRLAGITEHLRTSEFLPTQDHSGDYFVQYIDV